MSYVSVQNLWAYRQTPALAGASAYTSVAALAGTTNVPAQNAQSSRAVFAQALSAAEAAGLGTSGPPSDSAGKDAQLRWVARQMESFFLQEMLAGFRRTVPESGLFAPSFAAGTYEEMLDTERAKAMAESGGIGLAELVYEQMRG